VIREFLNDKNAVFCHPNVIGDWRLKLETLLVDAEHRLAFGEQARKDVKKYSWLKREEMVLEGF
jgi:hypothetical protein